jgi:hypothetical protein
MKTDALALIEVKILMCRVSAHKIGTDSRIKLLSYIKDYSPPSITNRSLSCIKNFLLNFSTSCSRKVAKSQNPLLFISCLWKKTNLNDITRALGIVAESPQSRLVFFYETRRGLAAIARPIIQKEATTREDNCLFLYNGKRPSYFTNPNR